MTFSDIQKELLDFGFVDITSQWYEDWKTQKAFRYGYSYYLVFDDPSLILSKNSIECDTSIGISPSQIRGFLAFLKLPYNDRRNIQRNKLLHLNELYKQIKSSPYQFDLISYERFAKEYEDLDFKHLKTNEYLVITE